MIPFGDNLPTLHRPWVTYGLLLALIGVWVFVQGAALEPYRLIASVCNLGMVPGELTGMAPVGYELPIAPGVACVVDEEPINMLTPLTSMFLHGSWGHLISNSLFLWVFGNNVEDSMGHGRFLAFYILCGLTAAAAHVAVGPASPIPTVGASGAISGVLGGYLLLYPWARIRMFFPPIFLFPIKAWLVLIYWFAVQLLQGLPELRMTDAEMTGGVAVWAHVGGFVAGLALIPLFKRQHLVDAHKVSLVGHPEYGGRA